MSVVDPTTDPKWVKLTLALMLTLTLLAVGFPYFSNALAPEAIVDQGNRPLLIIHVSGATQKPSLAFEASASVDGDLDLVFSISQPGITYDKDGTSKPLKVTALAVQRESEDALTCASEGYEGVNLAFVDLPASVRSAIIADAAVAGPHSAVNYESDSSSTNGSSPGSITEHFKTERFDVVRGETWLVNEDAGKPYQGEATAYYLKCQLPRGANWRPSSRSAWPEAYSTTFLPPQVNFVSDDSGESAISGLEGWLKVDRSTGFVLRESYPAVLAESSRWSYQFQSFRSGDRLLYTDQPTLIFSRRSSGDEKAIALMIIGAGLAVAVGLLASLASAAIDYAWKRAQRR